jgi:iron complex outermembrane receptor protein
MLPLSSIERVEIVRGGGAVQYGAGASGGVINVITRLPAAGERSAEMKLQAGSLGTREASIAGAFGTGPLALRLYASHFESDGYRANNRDEQEVGQGDLRWRDGANTVTARFALDRQSTRLPGARTVQPSVGLDEVATAPRGTSTPLDYATRDGARASVDFDRVLDVGELNIGLGWRNKKQVSFFELGGFPDYREIDLTVLGLTPRLRIAHTVAGASASTTVGVDVYRWDYRRLVSDAQANIGQPVNTVKAAQNTSALYVATNIAFATGTTVSGGVRGERYRISANDTYDATAPGAAFGSGAPAGDQSLNQHAWDVGVRQALSRGWALIGKAGRSYRFANVDEIYGFSPLGTRQFAFLRPQTAVGGEVAVDYDTPGAAARLSMFRLDVDDELRFDPYTFINTNLAPLRREGVELGGRVQAARTLGLTAAYTYTRARFRDGVAPGTPGFTLTDVALAGRTVPLVPAHLLALGATWAPVAEVKLSASARHVGSAVMDNDENNTLATRIPAHTLVDLRAVWDVAGWQVGFNVNNLFNRSYFNYAVRSTSTFTPDRYNAYPLPGRTMLVTASYRFR